MVECNGNRSEISWHKISRYISNVAVQKQHRWPILLWRWLLWSSWSSRARLWFWVRQVELTELNTRYRNQSAQRDAITWPVNDLGRAVQLMVRVLVGLGVKPGSDTPSAWFFSFGESRHYSGADTLSPWSGSVPHGCTDSGRFGHWISYPQLSPMRCRSKGREATEWREKFLGGRGSEWYGMRQSGMELMVSSVIDWRLSFIPTRTRRTIPGSIFSVKPREREHWPSDWLGCCFSWNKLLAESFI